MGRRQAPLRLLAIAVALVVSGCAAWADDGGPGTTGDAAASGGQPLEVYATTGYLADAVANLAPDADVTTMVGPGGDPHTYQPSTRDIATILDADLVLWNGLHLEARMTDQLQSLGDRQLAVGEQLPDGLLLHTPPEDGGTPVVDPHIWNSPEAWTLVVGEIADKLAELDPDHAADYRANATDYVAEIAAADAEATRLLDTLPADSPRILVTGHDAFAYFGATHDLEVHATDFVSSEAQLSAGALSGVADLIAENEIPAIFRDNQANPQAITSLEEAVAARGADVEISDQELYADSLGAEPGVDTYLGAYLHNARAIADALGGTA